MYESFTALLCYDKLKMFWNNKLKYNHEQNISTTAATASRVVLQGASTTATCITATTAAAATTPPPSYYYYSDASSASSTNLSIVTNIQIFKYLGLMVATPACKRSA